VIYCIFRFLKFKQAEYDKEENALIC